MGRPLPLRCTGIAEEPVSSVSDPLPKPTRCQNRSVISTSAQYVTSSLSLRFAVHDLNVFSISSCRNFINFSYIFLSFFLSRYRIEDFFFSSPGYLSSFYKWRMIAHNDNFHSGNFSQERVKVSLSKRKRGDRNTKKLLRIMG